MTIPLMFGPYGSVELPTNIKDYGVNARSFHGLISKRTMIILGEYSGQRAIEFIVTLLS